MVIEICNFTQYLVRTRIKNCWILFAFAWKIVTQISQERRGAGGVIVYYHTLLLSIQFIDMTPFLGCEERCISP